MYCSQCGNLIRENARFCARCGVATGLESPPNLATQRGNRAKSALKWVGAGLVGLFGLLVITAVVASMSESQSFSPQPTPVPTPTLRERAISFENTLNERWSGWAWGFQMRRPRIYSCPSGDPGHLIRDSKCYLPGTDLILSACIGKDTNKMTVKAIAADFVEHAERAYGGGYSIVVQMHRCEVNQYYTSYIPRRDCIATIAYGGWAGNNSFSGPGGSLRQDRGEGGLSLSGSRRGGSLNHCARQ